MSFNTIKEWNVDQFMSADGWYFIHTDNSGTKTLHRVALWGVNNKEQAIYGFISCRKMPGKYPVGLQPVPMIEGLYVHKDDLSLREKEMLEKNKEGAFGKE